MRFPIASGVLAAALASSLLLAAGCAQSPQGARADAFQVAPRASGAAAATLPRARPAPLRTQRVAAELLAGMYVPYDNMSLPLISPDGRYLATQTRIGPDWPTILAEFDADVPYATHIEIYELFADPEPGGYPEVQFVVELEEPALLGRSYDKTGFLIEAPQEDGSRWIGHVGWSSGEVTWLVADESVNAFAALGPDGRLAWCRRPVDAVDEAMFELVVRSGEDEWIVESPSRRPVSWLMPTWSWRGDGLFALTLAEGRLEAMYASASDPGAFRQSRMRLPLAIEASVLSAYQSVGAQVCGPGSTGAAQTDAFIFFHPSQLRMAIWRPTATGSARGMTLLDRLSYAAVLHDRETALVSTEAALLLRPIERERERSEVIVGTNVPRVLTDGGQWPYMLLGPEDGRVAVIPMRPLEPRELANR